MDLVTSPGRTSSQRRKLKPSAPSSVQTILLLLLLSLATSLGASIELTPDFVDNLLDKPMFPLAQFGSSWKTSGFCDTSFPQSPDENSIDTMKRLIFSQMLTFPELSLIYAGFEDDGFYGYTRNTSTAALEYTVRDPADATKTVFNVEIDPVTSLEPSPRRVQSAFAEYFPTRRPWYKHFTEKAAADPMSNKEFPPYWSSIYAFAEKGQPLGMTLSSPIYKGGDPTAPIVGVLGVDFRLVRLSNHMKEIFGSKIVNYEERKQNVSAAFIIEEATHDVVAASHFSSSTFYDGESRVIGSTSEDPMIKHITEFLTSMQNPKTKETFISHPYNISAGESAAKRKDFSINNHFIEAINAFKVGRTSGFMLGSHHFWVHPSTYRDLLVPISDNSCAKRPGVGGLLVCPLTPLTPHLPTTRFAWRRMSRSCFGNPKLARTRWGCCNERGGLGARETLVLVLTLTP